MNLQVVAGARYAARTGSEVSLGRPGDRSQSEDIYTRSKSPGTLPLKQFQAALTCWSKPPNGQV